MKERPIIFGAESVRAILKGRKTQTRRVVPKRYAELLRRSDTGLEVWTGFLGWRSADEELADPTHKHAQKALRGHWATGDRLWVRESFWSQHDTDCDDYSTIDCGPILNLGPQYCRVQYCATPENPDDPERPGDWFYYPPQGWDGESEWEPAEDRKEWAPWGERSGDFYTKHPSIHMPRWASRLTLEIKSVRVERVQAISEDDALAEGMEAPRTGESDCGEPAEAVYEFARHWDAINGKKHPWESNPWVWAVSFERVPL